MKKSRFTEEQIVRILAEGDEGDRQDPRELSRFDRIMLIIGGLMNPDRKAAREETHGFDYMDKGSIRPIVERIRELQA